MSLAPTRSVEAATERREALCALLGAPFVGADEPAYALVRHHE
ncbi:MAG: hypothetical protein QOI98_2788, partial [Solirubrobacteraceae bacterium]|nr:hypothetical protein [Solirubrobacteraceae bacterium]